MTNADAEVHAAAAELDERLKAAFEPQPAAVERVVRGALVGRRRPAGLRRTRRRLLGLAAGAALAAAALLVAVRHPPPFQSLSPPHAPAAPRSAIEIRNGGGMVTARSPSGRLWVIGAGTPHAAAGSIILVHKGGNR